MTAPTSPPDWAVKLACETAALSPCRSKRGVVLYLRSTEVAEAGRGYNGPPRGFACPGREVCAGTCGKRCVHAEIRALRDITQRELDLVHVELAADGGVVACDGPRCPGCSAWILDVGIVAGVWLYEEVVRRCLACHRFEDGSAKPSERYSRCPECSADLTPHGRWRYRTAADFHRQTLENCGLVP
jgi:deoxycytidylate deaminase